MSDFRKIKEIGEGAYGTVYSARDLANDKIVAVKSVNKAKI